MKGISRTFVWIFAACSLESAAAETLSQLNTNLGFAIQTECSGQACRTIQYHISPRQTAAAPYSESTTAEVECSKSELMTRPFTADRRTQDVSVCGQFELVTDALTRSYYVKIQLI